MIIEREGKMHGLKSDGAMAGKETTTHLQVKCKVKREEKKRIKRK
jgi:hypothetical protein